ncbi:MAG: hypothetical protein CSH37_15575 [Thalassolituus sp.]|nr:MAG: hypothetical protein CSH37_15575 [Thalassolituus sp.]
MKLLQVCLLTAVLSACSSIAPKNEPASEDNIAGIVPEQSTSDVSPPPQTAPETEKEFSEPLAPATSWDRVVSNFGLELDTSNERVKRHMGWYLKHPRHLEQVSDRARRYLHYIASEVERREIPGELALLPVVESAFDPFAYSHGRASGVAVYTVNGAGLRASSRLVA